MFSALLPQPPDSPADVLNGSHEHSVKSIHFCSFPDEIILSILNHLDVSTLAKFARCNHHLALLVRDNHLWRALFFKHLTCCTGFGTFPVHVQTPKFIKGSSAHHSVRSLHNSFVKKTSVGSINQHSQDSLYSSSSASSFFSFSVSPFCKLFRRNYLTALNWRKGNFRVSKVTRQLGSIHTDFDLNNTLVVSLSIHGPSLWNYASASQPIQLINDNTAPFTTIKLTDQYIISASRDTIVRVWDKNSFQLICTLSGIHGEEVGVLVCDQDLIVSGSEDSSLQVWQLPQGRPLETFRGLHTQPITAIAADVSHQRIVSASADGTIWIHQKKRYSTSKTVSCQFNKSKNNTHNPEQISVFAIALSKDFIITGDANGTIDIYRLDRNNVKKPVHVMTKIKAHAGPVICLQVDGHKWVSGSGDCTIKVWTLYEDDGNSGPLYTITHSALTGPIHSLKYNDNVLVCSDIASTVVEYDFSYPVESANEWEQIGHPNQVQTLDDTVD